MKHVSQALTTSSPSNNVTKTIIDRLRTKSSNDLLRGISPLDGPLHQPAEGTTNVTRLERIFKGNYTSGSPSN